MNDLSNASDVLLCEKSQTCCKNGVQENGTVSEDRMETTDSPEEENTGRPRVDVNCPINIPDACLLENKSEKHNDILVVSEKEVSNKVSSLHTIAVEYGNSDSDSEITIEKQNTSNDVQIIDQEPNVNSSNKDKENTNEVQIVYEENRENYRTNATDSSSSEESDSDESSSSEDSTSIDSDESDGSDSRCKTQDTAKTSNKKAIHNELDDLPPIEDLKISVPEVLCEPFGQVAWVVDQLVVVRPKPGKPTLNLDTILFVEKGGKALGKIFDVFGQVAEPHYCIRFNSAEHIKQNNVEIGMIVYYCPNTEYTSLVFLHELVKMKGTDSVGDNEPPEFSDDEEERAYYEALKKDQAKEKQKSNEEVPHKRKRTSSSSTGWHSNHPWNRNAKTNNRQTYAQTSNRQYQQNDFGGPNMWPSFPYQNNSYWPNQQQMHPVYGYEPYSAGFQTAYTDQGLNSTNQNFSQQHYYNQGCLGPQNYQVSFGAPPKFGTGVPFPPRPQSFPSIPMRPPYANTPWQSQSQSQTPPNMRLPWTPPPPPPPPDRE